jgi:resolvase-like protein
VNALDASPRGFDLVSFKPSANLFVEDFSFVDPFERMPIAKTIQNPAIYARVSTSDQNCDMQLRDLREYCHRRGWRAIEYIDTGVSGRESVP